MFILIGEENEKMINFKKSLTDSAVLLNMPCELANIPKDATIMIPFSRVLDNGVIEGTKFFIEEILLAPKVKRIVFGNKHNQAMLKKLCSAFHVDYQFK